LNRQTIADQAIRAVVVVDTRWPQKSRCFWCWSCHWLV